MKYEYEVILNEQANSIFIVGTELQFIDEFVIIFNDREIVAHIYKPSLGMIKSRKLKEDGK